MTLGGLLDDSQEAQLDELLRVRLDGTYSRAALKDMLGDVIAARIPNADSPHALVINVRKFLLTRGLEQDPPLILQVLKGFYEDAATSLMEALRARIPSPPGRPVSPYEALRLEGGRPFLGRAAIRDLVRTAEEPQGSRIVAVDGEAGAGCSYTVEYLRYLQRAIGRFLLAYCDLSELENRQDAAEVAQTLVERVAMNATQAPPAQDFNRPDRWLRKLADWTFNELKRFQMGDAERRSIWVVCDGISKLDREDGAVHFVRHLARSLKEESGLFRGCLILLECNDAVLSSANVVYALERAEAIHWGHVQDYLSAIHPDKSDVWVRQALQGLQTSLPDPSDQRNFLPKMNLALGSF